MYGYDCYETWTISEDNRKNLEAYEDMVLSKNFQNIMVSAQKMKKFYKGLLEKANNEN